MPSTALPFGTWPSTFSAIDAATASCDFGELRVAPEGLLWSRFDPRDARTTLWVWQGGAPRCLTPPGQSVRSRVHEYGGGAFCVLDGAVAFVDEADQQLWLQPLDGDPLCLAGAPGSRLGDLAFDRQGRAVLAVEEQHGDGPVRNRLVSLDLGDGQRRVVAEGADFYAAPTLSEDGLRLAWIEWDRPAQPWTSTRLCCAWREAMGGWSAPRVVAGEGGGESLQQPRFDARRRLLCLSDRDGAWRPWGETADGWLPLPGCARLDHAPAPWQLGLCTWLSLAPGQLLLSRFEGGFGHLVEQQGHAERRLAPEWTRFRALAADARAFYCIAHAPDRSPAVLAVDRIGGEVQVLAGGERPLPAEAVPRPEAITFASGGEPAHGFFYPPCNPACEGPADERPPLLVFVHGGPTSACYPQFDPRILFWTQRGFAVFDLNYRGSSGYGRAYRQGLQGRWGEVDVADARAVVAHLAGLGRIDPARAFIRGASAGGFTTLLALAGDTPFRAGTSLYGVSEPLALRRVTHKFEADYLDWLIGDPVRDAARYHARSPALHPEAIRAPVLFFQGGRDVVVVPEQTRAMADALQRLGREAQVHVYPAEGHGFRQAANLAHALEAEYGFYRRWL